MSIRLFRGTTNTWSHVILQPTLWHIHYYRWKGLARRVCPFSSHSAPCCLHSLPSVSTENTIFHVSFCKLPSSYLQSLHFSWGLSYHLCLAVTDSDYLFIYLIHIWVSAWCPHRWPGPGPPCHMWPSADSPPRKLRGPTANAEERGTEHALGALTKGVSVTPMTPLPCSSFLFSSSLVAQGLTVCHFCPFILQVPRVCIRHLPFKLGYHMVSASPKRHIVFFLPNSPETESRVCILCTEWW